MTLKYIILPAILLSFSVAEAKKSAVKKSSRAPASADQAGTFCGVLALGSSGTGNLTTYTIVDQPASGNGQYYNVSIPQDAEISDIFAPRPGDSEPDHRVRIGKDRVYFRYGGDFFNDQELTHGKCICAQGVRTTETNSLNVLDGYAVRDGKCGDVSQEAVSRFAGHQN